MLISFGSTFDFRKKPRGESRVTNPQFSAEQKLFRIITESVCTQDESSGRAGTKKNQSGS